MKIQIRRGRRVLVCALMGLVIFACTDTKDNIPNDATEQTESITTPSPAIVRSGGLEISVSKIDVVQEREVMPGFGDKMVAKAGRAFAVLHLAVKYSDDETKLDVQRLSLIDIGGRSYKPAVIRTNACDAKTEHATQCELPFDVPADAVFAKLRLDEIEIPLTR